MTDRMAALASRPTGMLPVLLSSGPIDRWVGAEEWKRRRVMEGLGWRALTSSVRTTDLLASGDSKAL